MTARGGRTVVVDASVIAEVLLNTRSGQTALPALRDRHLVAPDILPAEVLSVLRGWSCGGHLTELDGRRAIGELREMDIELLPVTPLLRTAWTLRHNVSAYDACYVAMARSLEATLLTFDRRLVSAVPEAVVPAGA